MTDQDFGSPTKGGWRILGPGGGGCVHTLTVNPSRPATMVVSCDMTAGYISRDAGGSWREFNLKSRQYAYSFDPRDPDTIWVGSSGLFKSTDAGETWNLVYPDPARLLGETRLDDECRHEFIAGDNWPGKTVHAILVDPVAPDRVYIALKKKGPPEPFDHFKPVRREGILVYATEDGGATWRERAALDAADIHLLALDPGSPAEARGLFAFTEKALFCIEASGRIRPAPLPSDIRFLNHASVGRDPRDGATVFYLVAFADSPGGQAGSTILRSRDSGESWERLGAGIEALGPAGAPWISQVSACASDARRVWAILERFPEREGGGGLVDRYGIIRSDDCGATWKWAVKHDDFEDPPNRTGGWAERDYGALHGDIAGDGQISPKGRFCWDVVASPVDPDACWTMDFSTIFATLDAGRSWAQLVTNLGEDGSASSRGIDVLGAYGVIFDPFDPEHLVLPLTDVGMFRSRDGGRTWLHAIDGVPRRWINTCYWMVFDPEVRGRAWSAWSAMHDIPRLKMFRDEFFERDEGGVCRTEDGLSTWAPSAEGLPAKALCTHVVLDPASPAGKRTLYAAVFGRGVWKSADDGRTWSAASAGIDPANLFAWRLLLAPGGALYLVVVKNRLKDRGRPGAVYRSDDGARTWRALSLPDGVDFPNDLARDPAGRLYLAAWPRLAGGSNAGGGAWASDDGGATWRRIFDEAAHVYALAVDPLDQETLYLTTFDAGAWRSADRGETWNRIGGFNFQWAYRPVPDPRHRDMLFITTFGSSVWYGPAEGVPDAVEDITDVRARFPNGAGSFHGRG